MNMSREQLIGEIKAMYVRLGDSYGASMDYAKFTTVELWNHFQRKNGKVAEKPKGTIGGGWYSNYTPRSKPLNHTPSRRTEVEDLDDTDKYKNPKTKAKDKNDRGLSLQGFGALNFAKGGDSEQ